MTLRQLCNVSYVLQLDGLPRDDADQDGRRARAQFDSELVASPGLGGRRPQSRIDPKLLELMPLRGVA